MKRMGLALVLVASLCSARDPADFRPATTNVLGAEHPRVDSAGRVEVRFKAPDARKVRLLWLGVGTDEPERMCEGIRRLHAALLEARIQHAYYESPGTDHEWQTWRRDLEDFAPRLFK